MDRFLQRSASWIIKSGLKLAGIHLRKRKNCPNIGVRFFGLQACMCSRSQTTQSMGD